MKKVKYKGAVYIVPDWVNFMATDNDGEIYGHENKPRISKLGELGGLYWESYPNPEILLYSPSDWKRSLEEVQEVK